MSKFGHGNHTVIKQVLEFFLYDIWCRIFVCTFAAMTIQAFIMSNFYYTMAAILYMV
jgi:hypothetical protein